MTHRVEFRLDDETLAELDLLIKKYRDTRSHIVRLAIKEFKLKSQREGKDSQ